MTPKLFNLYKKDYEQKKQDEVRMADYTAWLNGWYVMHAIGAVANSKNKYPEKTLYERQEEEEFNNTSEGASIQFGAWADAFNRNFKGGEVSGR